MRLGHQDDQLITNVQLKKMGNMFSRLLSRSPQGDSRDRTETAAANPHGNLARAPPLISQIGQSGKVDAYLKEHMAEQDSDLRYALQACLSNSIARGLPPVAVSPALGKFLMMQCKVKNISHVLEIGTLGGYSAIWCAVGAGCSVTSLEISPDHAAVAQENLAAAGIGNNVDIVIGDARHTLRRIVDDIQTGKSQRPGLAFVDANKDAALEYFNLAVEAVGNAGIVVVDNLVRYGYIVDEAKVDEDAWIQGIRALIESVGQDKRVDATIFRTLSEGVYDGFLYAVVK